MIYQPDREYEGALSTTWSRAVAAFGERAWLFEDVNCDFAGTPYSDRFAKHRVVAVNLGGTAYTVVRPMDVRLDSLMQP